MGSEQWIGISCRPDRLLSENITESGKQYGYESGDRRVSVLFPEKGTSRVFGSLHVIRYNLCRAPQMILKHDNSVWIPSKAGKAHSRLSHQHASSSQAFWSTKHPSHSHCSWITGCSKESGPSTFTRADCGHGLAVAAGHARHHRRILYARVESRADGMSSARLPDSKRKLLT